MEKYYKTLVCSFMLFGANVAFADDYSIVCYGVSNNTKQFAAPCVLERSFKTGYESSIYSFKDKTYNVLIDGNSELEITLINEKPAKRYYRNDYFEKTNEDDTIGYECYQSASIHFCAQRAGYK